MKRRIHSIINKCLNEVIYGKCLVGSIVLPENQTSVTARRIRNNEYSLTLKLRGDDVPEVK